MVNRSRSNHYALLTLVWVISFQALARPQLPADYLPLPLVRQKTDYSCGPAAYLSILKYWDLFTGPEEDLYPLLKTSEKDGTNPKEIVRAAGEMKLAAHYEEKVTVEKLKTSLINGETVILDLQAWSETEKPWKDTWEDGHYIVLIGLDDEYLYAMDPSISKKYGYLPLNELEERWHDYETEKGQVWKNYQLAIFIKGQTPGKPFPPPEKLARIQ